MKYVFPKMGNFTKLGGHIQILDRRMLEMNVSVHLVQVGSKYFLLGSSSKNLTLLSEISAKDAVTHSQTTPEIPNVGASFAEILAKVRAVLPRKKDEE
jgi:flagellar biogenesis protein FliO